MSQKEAKKRIDTLRDSINKYNYKYYVLDEPEITDAVWDSLNNELKKLETNYPELVDENSPTLSLIHILKGYAKHEKSTFEEVTKARTAVMNTPEDLSLIHI